MKYRLVILTFVLSIAAFLVSSTTASSRYTGAQGGCLITARLLKSPMQQMSDPEWIGRYRRCSTAGVVNYFIRGMVIAKT